MAVALCSGSVGWSQTPIEFSSGWNADIVFELDSPYVTAGQDGGFGNFAWVQDGLEVGGLSRVGLPVGFFTSQTTNQITGGYTDFTFQDFGSNNVLRLDNNVGGTTSASFVLANPEQYDSLHILDSSSPAAPVDVVLHFVGGGSATIPLNGALGSTNWSSMGDRTVLGALSRAQINMDGSLGGFGGQSFHIHESTLDLAAFAGLIASIEFKFGEAAEPGAVSAIWGISGVLASTVFDWSGGGPGNYVGTPLPTDVDTNWAGGTAPRSDASSVLRFETREFFGAPGNIFDPVGYGVHFTESLQVGEFRFKEPRTSYSLTAAPNVSVTLGGYSELAGRVHNGVIYLRGSHEQVMDVPLILGANALVNNANAGQGELKINGPIQLGPFVLTVGGTGIAGGNTFSGSGNVRLAGALSGAGTLEKTGLGVLTVTNANTGFQGGTRVLGGTMTLDSGGRLGSGDLEVSNYNVHAGNAVTLNLHSSQTVGSLSGGIGPASSGTNTATIQLHSANASLVLRQMGDTTFAGAVSGSGGVTMGHGSNATLTFTAVQTYTGDTTLRGGRLLLDLTANPSGILSASSTLNMAGGQLWIRGSSSGTSSQTLGDILLEAGGSSLVADANSGAGTTVNLGAFGGGLVGSSLAIRSLGASVINTTSDAFADGTYGGRVVFTDANGFTDWASSASSGSFYAMNRYTGYTSLATAAGTDAQNSLVTDDVALDAGPLTRTTNSLKIENTTAGRSLGIGADNTLVLSNGGLLFTGANAYAVNGGTLKGSSGGDLVVQQFGTGTLSIGSVIADHGTATALTKSGPGTLHLTNSANTFTGPTFVNEGILRLAADGSLGPAPGSVAAAHLVLHGGTVQLGAEFDLASNRGILLAGQGGTLDTQSFNTTYAGVIAGGAGLTKAGAGTLVLSGNNTFTGGVTLAGGTLQMGSAGALNATAGQQNSVTFTAGSTAKLQLNGHSPTVSGLSSHATPGSPIVENGAASAATLTVRNARNETFAGVLQNGGAGALAVTKENYGSLRLTGNNTFTGSTTVRAGTLEAGGAGALGGTSSIRVETGGTLLLGGALADNRLNDSAAFELAGGTLALNGRQELGAGNTAGVGALTLTANSVIDFAMEVSRIQFSGIGSVSSGALLAIRNWAGTPVTGGGASQLRFTGEVSEFTSHFAQSQISFDGQLGYKAIQFDGYYEISVIPEPGTIAGVALLLGAIGWRERRRLLPLVRRVR